MAVQAKNMAELVFTVDYLQGKVDSLEDRVAELEAHFGNTDEKSGEDCSWCKHDIFQHDDSLDYCTECPEGECCLDQDVDGRNLRRVK